MVKLFSKTPKIIKLTPNDFENGILNPKSIKNKKIAYVMFYADWCPHCHRAAPEWLEFSKTVPKSTVVCVMDSVKYPELAHELGVNGYPTIKVFNQHGMFERDYSGNPSAESLKEFHDSMKFNSTQPQFIQPVDALSSNVNVTNLENIINSLEVEKKPKKLTKSKKSEIKSTANSKLVKKESKKSTKSKTN